MNKKKKVKQKKRWVEDHGNGFMFVGFSLDEARVEIEEYSDEPHPFAHPCFYEGRGSTFLSPEPGALYDGATTANGELIPRD
jgi:hypothetical protein